MVLLVGAGLLGKSFYRLLHIDIGLQPDHLAMMRLRAPRSGYAKDDQVVALARRVMEETGRLPGVQSVAIAHQIPVANVAGGNTTFEIIGRPQHGITNESSSRQVSVGYFSTVQARLSRGRYFSETDDASKPHVMIVNQSFARKYFAGEDPIGKQVRYDASSPVIEIVGVVDDIKEGPLDEEVQPVLYTPFNQEPDSAFFVVVRTAQPAGAIEVARGNRSPCRSRRSDLQRGDDGRPDQPLSVDLPAPLVGLACGRVCSDGFAVGSCRPVWCDRLLREPANAGNWCADGAGRAAQLCLKEAGRLTGVGILAGLVCSVATASLMRNLLFGTQPWDAGTLVGVAIVLAVSALLASYIPARRAASVDPVEALRAE
jgi:hypothetical protein